MVAVAAGSCKTTRTPPTQKAHTERERPMSVKTHVMTAFAGVVASLACVASAQVANLRITEVDAVGRVAEIQNTGPVFTTAAAHPFCHRFNYATSIPSGTNFTSGQYRTFSISNLNTTDSDLWLYISSPFGTAGNIIHGVKYGPAANVGRTGLASGRIPPLWTGSARFAPAPVAGQTLAWDGFGIDPRDWYIDATPTLGSADFTNSGTVANSIVPAGGVQTFEDVSLGDTVEAISEWFIVDSSDAGRFTVRSVHDVNGSITPRGSSTRWLRIRDQDATDVQNRFYSATVTVPGAPPVYTWSFFLNIEEVPPAPGAGSLPRLLIQHDNGGGTFVNTWGIELSSAGGSLIGPGLSGLSLFPLSGSTGLLNWIRVDFTVDLNASTISASVNGTAVVTDAAISIPDVSSNDFRFCYRGEGTGNIASILLDDIELSFTSAPPVFCPGDADGSGTVSFSDITSVLASLGADYTPGTGPGDADGNGLVNFSDITSVLANLGVICP